MSQSTPTVLVPIDVSSDAVPAPALLDFLAPASVVLLGWYPVPHQTGSSHIQAEREDEAVAAIESVAATLPDAMDVATTVVFTRDREQTIDRIADEYGCDVVLLPDDITQVERVFVPIRSDVTLTRILPLVSTLLETNDASCTLFHAAAADAENPEAGEMLLNGASDELGELGVAPEQITTTHVVAEKPTEALIDAAQNHDLIVMGETEPSLIDRILGDIATTLISQSNRLVLVVRNI